MSVYLKKSRAVRGIISDRQGTNPPHPQHAPTHIRDLVCSAPSHRIKCIPRSTNVYIFDPNRRSDDSHDRSPLEDITRAQQPPPRLTRRNPEAADDTGGEVGGDGGPLLAPPSPSKPLPPWQGAAMTSARLPPPPVRAGLERCRRRVVTGEVLNELSTVPAWLRRSLSGSVSRDIDADWLGVVGGRVGEWVSG